MKENKTQQLSLETVHEELLKLLRSFSDYCDEIGVRYFLSGGSIIGAVRHHGFIPWDDDLDVMMLREDYDKVIRNFSKFNPGYRLNCLETVQDWQYPFAKIDLPTTYIEDKYRIVQHGLFIDIFPIDKLPDDKNAQEKIAKRVKMLDLLRGSGTKKEFRPEEEHLFVKRMIKPYANWRGPNYFARKIDELARKTNEKNQASNNAGVMVVSTHGIKEYLPAQAFSSSVDIEFESMTAKLFSGYKEYLGNLYGDYMKLPPKSEQVPAHYQIFWNNQVRDITEGKDSIEK